MIKFIHSNPHFKYNSYHHLLSRLLISLWNLAGCLIYSSKLCLNRCLIKKPSLDPSEFKNFRPISDIQFISTIIEECVAKRLIEYLSSNCLVETFQSAYKSNHSMETALIRVFNDMNQSKTTLINCVKDINAWMLSNKLKLNRDKSEVSVLSSIYRPRPTPCSVDICNETVLCSTSTRNIGAIVGHHSP